MLHHHGAGAGSPYMAPTTAATGTAPAPFSPTPPAGPAVPVTDIPAAPPPTMHQLQPAGPSANFEELRAGGSGSGAGAQDDDMQMQPDFGGGGASGSGGQRWPREETLALIRIRTEMDAEFRNAPLKGPLWEDVARKLAVLGYHRSAKKCKEKFENVDKYYKRTKDARAGRHDGKSYRFFSQLEALHAAAPPPPPPPSLLPPSGMATAQRAAPHHQPMAAMTWTTAGPTAALGPPSAGAGLLPDLSFSSMSGSESDSGSDGSESDSDDDGSDADAGEDRSEGDRDEMMAIFEGMMKQVTAKQDAMQRAFLDTLERWEAERTAREEAWRRQEVARVNLEREQLARDRAAAASRDAALIAFLQRVGGGNHQPAVRLPPPPPPPPHTTTAAAAAVPAPPSPSPRHDAAAAQKQQLVLPAPPALLTWAGGEGGSVGPTASSSSSSRWPKEEVEALIEMRKEKDAQYSDAGGGGGKGPLWEDIAAGMRRVGYSRSAKRCKEKWENINKYYKKVKESNKRRPDDSKTCPYFHQLDAMYRKKHRAGGSTTAAVVVQNSPSQREIVGKSSHDDGGSSRKNEEQGKARTPPAPAPAPPGNGEDTDTAPPTTNPPRDGAKNKQRERAEEGDGVKETDVVLQQQQQQEEEEFGADETDSDDDIDMVRNYTVYTVEGNDDEDKMKNKVTGFQKPSVIGSGSNVPVQVQPPPPAAAAGTAAAATSSAAPTSSTFLAVQ